MILPENQKLSWIWVAEVVAGETYLHSSQRYVLIYCIRVFEAAADFPHCELTAIDLVPLQKV
jgi:hypothetical protein